ncbi:MAG: hypothetical protein ACLP50_36275 [Solirubrobacteraceae bacterium]
MSVVPDPEEAKVGGSLCSAPAAPGGAARLGGRDARLDAGRWRQAGDAWRWAPLACAVFYVVVLLATLRSLVASIYLNADIAAAPDIGQLVSRAPHFAEIVLGNAPWYTALWFEQLTAGLPGHRTLWELAPWILTLIGIALVAWAAAQIAGRWAGAVIGLSCGCAGATLLPLQFGWAIHAVAYVHICVLGAFVVPLALRSGRIGGWPSHVVLAAVVAVVTGLGMASDKLVIVGGLAPFVIAGAVLWYLVPSEVAQRVLWSVLGVAVGACVVAELATSAAHSADIVPAPFPISFAALGELPGHLADLVGSLVILANGDFSGDALSLTGVLALLCAGAAATGIYAALRSGRVFVRDLAARGRYPDSGASPRAAARSAFLAFWVATAVLVSAAFALSSVPKGLLSSRYVVTVGYAVVVIVVVSVASSAAAWRSILVAAGSSAIILAAGVSLAQRQIENTAYAPTQAVATRLARFAAREHLTIGYAGYWDASPLTWELDARLRVYPVIQCGPTLCPFPYHKINTWYLPRPLARTFFLVDSRLISENAYGAITTVPSSWGPPEQVAHIGQLTVYVYPYNLAGKLLLGFQ